MAKIKLSTAIQKDLINHWTSLLSTNASSSFHSYMKARDAEYAKWKKEDETNKSNFHVRLILSQADTARAKLSNIFLSDYPMFQVIAPANLSSVATQYNAIYEADSTHFGWKSELSVALFDGLKYNLQATEVDWVVETTNSLETAGVLTSKDAQTTVLWQGNRVKRLNLYNTFWDTSVAPKDIHREGDFAGYVSVYTPIRLHKLLTANNVHPILRKEMYKSSNILGTTPFSYTTPQLATWADAITPEDSAANFDIPESEIKSGKMRYTSGLHQVATVYERLIPDDYGITEAMGAKNTKEQSIFKFLVLNNKYVLSAEQLVNNHGYIPIVFGQPLDEGLEYQTKSFTHNLEELQDIASTLVTGEIKSMRRMLTDRGIYDPMLINKRDISSPNPSAKIPLRASAIGRNISDAYYPIPYEDRAMGSRMQQAMGLLSFGNETSGLNQVAQGQFVKGNKTNQQFQESMGSSGQRILSLAINLEDSYFSAIKAITKDNILQFQPPDKVLSSVMKQEVKISPEELKKLNPTFKISDGLIPADRIANAETLGMAIQIVSQTPELAMTYNVPSMIVHMLTVQGVRDLDQYKLSPEEMKARQAQVAQQAQAENPQQGQTNGQPSQSA